MKKCLTCRFWYKEDSECRRYPPTVVYDPQRFMGMSFQYPITNETEWCGEYQS